MSSSQLQLTTSRLLLRPIRRVDFDAWAALMADAQTTQYLGGSQSRATAWRGFMNVASAWHLDGFAMFSVIEKSTGRWVGRVGPSWPEGWPGSEISWAIRRDCWGCGYATEAAAATIDWAFTALGWSDVIHSISPGNVMSQAVARKLGSSNRGPGRLPPPYEHPAVDIWGQTRAQWYAASAAREPKAPE
jgi:RimJ/RimL family protein N-acetyltransferase